MKRLLTIGVAISIAACTPADPPVEITTPLFDGTGTHWSVSARDPMVEDAMLKTEDTCPLNLPTVDHG